MQTIAPADILKLPDAIVSAYVRLWMAGVMSWEQAMMGAVYELVTENQHGISKDQATAGPKVN